MDEHAALGVDHRGEPDPVTLVGDPTRVVGIAQRLSDHPGDADEVLLLQAPEARSDVTLTPVVTTVRRPAATLRRVTRVAIPQVQPQRAVVAQHPLDLAEHGDEVGDVGLGGGFEAELRVDPGGAAATIAALDRSRVDGRLTAGQTVRGPGRSSRRSRCVVAPLLAPVPLSRAVVAQAPVRRGRDAGLNRAGGEQRQLLERIAFEDPVAHNAWLRSRRCVSSIPVPAPSFATAAQRPLRRPPVSFQPQPTSPRPLGRTDLRDPSDGRATAPGSTTARSAGSGGRDKDYETLLNRTLDMPPQQLPPINLSRISSARFKRHSIEVDW